MDEVHEVVADVELFYHSDAGSLIFPERFLISGFISGAARGLLRQRIRTPDKPCYFNNDL